MGDVKHTPGPWAVLHASFEDSEENGKHIPVVSYAIAARDMSICAGNARLIAAAPDLLAALIDAENRLAGAGMLGADDKVSRAIAKATK